MRAVHGSTVLHPCDGNQTAKLVAAMADLDGISYIRTLRPNTPVALRAGRGVPDRRQPRPALSDDDEVTLVGCGITVHEALAGRGSAGRGGIAARVIDCYSIKPIDGETLAAAAEETGRIVTVEDHWPEGGLGEAVLAALAERDAAAQVRSWRSRTCRARARRTSCSPRSGSTRPRSPKRRALLVHAGVPTTYGLACTAAWPS